MATDVVFVEETDEERVLRYCALAELLRGGRRDLTHDEVSRVLAPAGPYGSRQNKHTGLIKRTLNGAGFTFLGRSL